MGEIKDFIDSTIFEITEDLGDELFENLCSKVMSVPEALANLFDK